MTTLDSALHPRRGAIDFDLPAYLRRIGHEGPTAPALATLRAIHRRQVAAIPFENLDPLAGRAVALDLESLQAKLVQRRRGGYCFELNALLEAALRAIGFTVTGLAARVRWMAEPASPLGPRTHMLLRVDLPQGAYLADAGFGGHLLDEPLELAAGTEQRTGAARYRLERVGDEFELAVRLAQRWETTYRFGLDPQVPADYEMASWYTSTHPQSWFTRRLLIERLTDDARYTLANTRLVERRRDGAVEERLLTGAAELGRALEEIFGLTPPVPVEALYERIAGS